MYLFLIFLAVLTTYNPSVMGFNFSNYIFVGSVTLAAFFGRSVIHRLKKNLLNFILLVLYLWIVVSNVFSVNHIVTIESTMKVTLLFIFYLFLDVIIKNKEDESKLWDYIILGNILSCIVGLFQIIFQTSTYHLAFGTELDALRVVGAFPTPNIYACFMSLSLPLVLINAINKKSIIWFIILIANGIVLYESYSRGSILSLVFAIIIWKIIDYAFISKSLIIRKKNLFFLLILSTSLVVAILYLVISGKLLFLFQSRGSNTERIDSIISALHYFADNPIGHGFGVGIGTILDSTYINLLVDLGIVGISLFLILGIVMLSRAIKLCKKINDLHTHTILLSVIVFFLLCILENVIYNSLLNFFLVIIWYELNYYKPKAIKK